MQWDGKLNNRFCSAGIDSDYYARIRDRLERPELVNELLSDLRDCFVNPLIREVFEGSNVYRDSLLRDQTTEKALEDAPVIISGLDYDDFYGINYRFLPDFDETIDTNLLIPFLFNPERYLRASAIIGENGVLKTKMLSV